MAGYTNVTLGGQELYITDIDAVKEQKTKKGVVGRTLIQTKIIGLSETQWSIKLTGYITARDASTLYSTRNTIEGLDNMTTHSYSDGLHNGTYYVLPGSIRFNDNETTAGTSIYSTYTIEIVQE